ncbi:MAG: response regulator [bacterium]|jgi:CheY-like chemotaxis protein
MSKKINNILLVDDDTVNNFIVINTLNKLAITENIDSVLNGLDGIEYLKAKIETNKELIPSVIFLDINMPIMDGWEFLEEFELFSEEVKNHCNIYMVSSSVYEEDILKSKQYKSVIDFISKPLMSDKIIEIYNEAKK